MLKWNKPKQYYQAGFSLVEIMVGLVIGLMATMVIVQVLSVFEHQKNSTTGSADAQTNGSIALYNIQRDGLMAGFGLPVFSSLNSALKCDPSPTVDHDSNAGTPPIGIFPITITDGGVAAGASDSIAIRYGPTNMGGIPIPATIATTNATVTNNLGCQVGDIALVVNGAICAMSRVASLPDATHITLTAAPMPAIASGSLACLGAWNEFVYNINNNKLERNGAPNVADIVNIQAQYGIAAALTGTGATDPNFNQIIGWVDASGATWGPTITVANRNRIKAIRVAIVARNGSPNRDDVTTACSSTTAAAPTGLCAWEGTTAFPAPSIDLSNTANWQKYRYRVFDTIVPLRNIIWSKGVL